MDLRRLRYFLAVVEERHLTRAADLLGIRATSLSQQILALERELGTALFVRTPAGMTPTAAALVLVPEARAVVASAERARQAVREAVAGAAPLRIGITPGCPTWLAPRLWTAVRRTGAELEPADVQTAAQMDALRRGDLDAGVVVLPLGGDPEGPADATWTTAVVSDVALGVLVGTDHRLARSGRASVGWTDLAGTELLWFPRAHAPGYHDAVLDACRAAGWTPAAVRERPPRRGLFAAELASGDDVLALRPAPDGEYGRNSASMDGTTWLPLADNAPRLRHALVWSAQHSRADLLARVARDLRDEADPHKPADPPHGRGRRAGVC